MVKLLGRRRSPLGPWRPAGHEITRMPGVRLPPAGHDRDRSLARAVESMSAGFLTLDADWRISYLNLEGRRLLGVGADMVGRTLWHAFPATVGTEVEWHCRRAVRTGRPVNFDTYLPEPLDAWYEVRAWVDADHRGLSLSFLDVTARRSVEQAAIREAERSRMLAGLSEALAEVTDQYEAVQRLATLAVPTLADWCVVILAGDDERQPGLAHHDPRELDATAAYAAATVDHADPEAPLWTMLANGAPFHARRLRPATVKRTFPDPVARRLLCRLAPTSGTAVPLTAQGRLLGVFELWNTGARPAHTALEISTAVEMGRRAGLAVDNAQLNARQRRLSETLQRSMLTEPVRTEHLEVTVRYRPAAHEAQVGGDWHDAFHTSDGSTCLVIGDVAGHDREAAAAMGQVRNLLRGIAYVHGGRPAPVLASLDQAIRSLGVTSLATAVLAVVKPAGPAEAPGTHWLRWSNAGHPPPLLIEPDGSVLLLRTKADLLLGVDSDTRRNSHERLLPPGTTVLLYTDGLIERRRASIDDGLDWLVTAAGELAGCTLDELCDGLLDKIGHYVEDDVALLGFRIEAANRAAVRVRTGSAVRPQAGAGACAVSQRCHPAANSAASVSRSSP
jgi:serine phosphatase RsbU (regulator of sigma subunit)